MAIRSTISPGSPGACLARNSHWRWQDRKTALEPRWFRGRYFLHFRLRHGRMYGCPRETGIRDGAAKRRMMALLATLRQSGGINAVARQLGLPPAAIMAAANGLLPGLVDRFRQCSGGIPGLLQLIAQAGGAGMAQAIMSEDKADIQPGVLLLARIGTAAAPAGHGAAGEALAPDIEARLTSHAGHAAGRLSGGEIGRRCAQRSGTQRVACRARIVLWIGR